MVLVPNKDVLKEDWLKFYLVRMEIGKEAVS